MKSQILCLSFFFYHSLWVTLIRNYSTYSYFELFWLKAICFNDELILWVSLQLCQPKQQCLLHMSGSGPSCNLRLITAGKAKSRNGTQLLPAALNYFSTDGFLSPSFSVSLSQLLRCLSLISPLFFPSLSLSIMFSPLLLLFLDLCFLLSASLHSFSTLLEGLCRVQWVWSFRLVLLSLLRVLERPIYR